MPLNHDNVPNDGKLFATMTDKQYEAAEAFLQQNASGHYQYSHEGETDVFTFDNSQHYAEFQKFADEQGIPLSETMEETKYDRVHRSECELSF